MNSLKTSAAHLVMAALVIGAAIVLAINKTITGGEAIGLIAGASGFSLGTAAASASPSTVAVPVSGGSASTGTPTPIAAVGHLTVTEETNPAATGS